MDTDREKIEQWLKSLSDDNLKKIIKVDFDNYKDYFIEMAKEELLRRNGNSGTGDLSIEDVLQSAEFRIETDDLNVGSNEKGKVRPWIRFWARGVDTTMLFLILNYIWSLLIPQMRAADLKYTYGWSFLLLNFLIWAFIEAYFLSKWGYTLGKWLFNIKVRNAEGEKLSYQKALGRVFNLLIYGHGLCVPFVSFVTYIVSYARLVDKGITKWDEKDDIKVIHGPIDGGKAFLAVLLLVVPSVLYMAVVYMHTK
ncbi:MAG TPA: RDD family protein [Clostridia bacterium]